MQPDPREPTGDLGYDTAHEVTGDQPRPGGGAPAPSPAGGRDQGTGDYGYDEAHDFRR